MELYEQQKKIIDKSQAAKVFEFYRQGYTAKEIEKATGYEYDYIDDLVWRWQIREVREKMKQPEPKDPDFVIPERPRNVNFALLTDDPKVIDAYNKMTNP